MRITEAENKFPETKEETIDLLDGLIESRKNSLGDVAKENSISIRGIRQNFESISDIWEELGIPPIKCEECSRTFERKQDYSNHQKSHEKTELDRKAEEVLKDVENHKSEGFYVYTIKIETEDGREFLYTGYSGDLFNRFRQHCKNDKEIPVPSDEEERIINSKFEVISLESCFRFDSIEKAKYWERKMFLETAIENETTEVLGGK